MPFGVVSGVGREMGVLKMNILDGVEIVEGEGAVFGVNVTNGDFDDLYCITYGVVILCREGWRRGSSQIITVFLVIFLFPFPEP